MKKKLPIILLGVILACVLVFGFLYANNDIGKTANSLEADIRQSQKISDDWIVDGSISDTMAAFISYPQDKTDHTFSVYENRPGLSFGYFFRGGGDIVEVDDYIAEFVVEGNNERAFISMNTQNIVRLEVDDGNGIQVIDIDSGKPFVCQTKTRKHEPCGGQTGYTLHILDSMIEDIVHEIFRRVRSLSKSEVLGASYAAKMSEQKAIIRKAQREYQKAENDLKGLRNEVVKAVNGESAFPLDLLSSLVKEMEQKCVQLQETYQTAQAEADKNDMLMDELRTTYNQFISWSNIYDTANIQTKKMIVCQLIERVDVFRGYELKVKFSISVEQFILGLDISA